MANTNWETAEQILLTKAVNKANDGKYSGKRPVETELRVISEWDICAINGKALIKVFYVGAKAAFYYNPKSKDELKIWLQLMEEELLSSSKENPFDKEELL